MDSENSATAKIYQPSSCWYWVPPLLALAVLLTLLLTGSNIATFLWLNKHTALLPDAWWSYLTALGDTSLALVFVLPLLGRRPEVVAQFFLAAVLAALVLHGFKDAFSAFRPPAVLAAGSFHLIGPVLDLNSFPSGHTTTAFVFAALICLQRLDMGYKLGVLLLAGCIGLSRIACGVHWPMDVMGGVITGWLGAIAARQIVQRSRFWQGIFFQRSMALILSLSALWGVFYYDNGFPDTWIFQLLVTMLCLGLSVQGQYRIFRPQ